MALDYGKLGLENKSGQSFCVRQGYFTKSCQQICGRVNQPFILFIHHIWGKTALWGTVFIIQSSDRMQYFTIFQYKLDLFNIQDDRSTRGLLAKPLKKISIQNHLYDQPAASCGVFEWTLIELPFNIIKNLTCLFFIQWFYNNVQSSKAFDTRGVLSTPASDVHERLKTNGTAIKNCKRDYWQSIKEI